ncbi:hypothetical protein EGW08_004375 [Elysia chlorotica]|uniref:Uncharacterized protein n=1 Tax=Elysia chlorotica TaxID=188477 RepID=A0A433U1Z5_ELYCH|nr:hypothetical protein EGW08_004375 [Elysia chlorotica]
MTFEGEPSGSKASWRLPLEPSDVSETPDQFAGLNENGKDHSKSSQLHGQTACKPMTLRKKMSKMRRRPCMSFSRSTVASRNKLRRRSSSSCGTIPNSSPGNSCRSRGQGRGWDYRKTKSNILRSDSEKDNGTSTHKRNRSFDKSCRISRLVKRSLNSGRDQQTIRAPFFEEERQSGIGSPGSRRGAKSRGQTKRPNEDDTSDSSLSSGIEGGRSKRDKEHNTSKNKPNSHHPRWRLRVKSYRHGDKEQQSHLVPGVGDVLHNTQKCPVRVNGGCHLINDTKMEAGKAPAGNLSMGGTNPTSCSNESARTNQHGAQSSESDFFSRSKSGSVYTTSTPINPPIKPTSSQQVKVSKGNDESPGCCGCCRHTCGSSGLKHPWQDPKQTGFQSNRFLKRNGEKAIENDPVSRPGQDACFSKSLKHSNCEGVMIDTFLDGKEKRNRHKSCCTLRRFRKDENSNKIFPKKRHKIACGCAKETPIGKCGSYFSDLRQEGINNEIKSPENTSSCDHFRRKNEMDNCRKDFDSQLESLVEYQTLLFQNIKYLLAQLDQITVKLQGKSATQTTQRSSQTRPHPRDDIAMTLTSWSCHDTNNSLPERPRRTMKGQPTRLVNHSASDTATDTVTGSLNVPGRSNNHHFDLDNTLEKSTITLNPNGRDGFETEPLYPLSIRLPQSVSKPQESISTAVQTTSVEDGHSGGHDDSRSSSKLQLSTARFSQLLKEMDAWKEKLQRTALLEGLPSTAVSRTRSFENNIKSIGISAAPPTESMKHPSASRFRDKNFSSCLSGEITASDDPDSQPSRTGSNLGPCLTRSRSLADTGLEKRRARELERRERETGGTKVGDRMEKERGVTEVGERRERELETGGTKLGERREKETCVTKLGERRERELETGMTKVGERRERTKSLTKQRAAPARWSDCQVYLVQASLLVLTVLVQFIAQTAITYFQT